MRGCLPIAALKMVSNLYGAGLNVEPGNPEGEAQDVRNIYTG